MADEAVSFLDEFQAHAFGVVVSAGEAEVFLEGEGFSGMAAGRVFGHISGHVGCIVAGFLESRGGRLSSKGLRGRSGGRQWRRKRQQVPMRLRPFGMTSLFLMGEERGR